MDSGREPLKLLFCKSLFNYYFLNIYIKILNIFFIILKFIIIFYITLFNINNIYIISNVDIFPIDSGMDPLNLL